MTFSEVWWRGCHAAWPLERFAATSNAGRPSFGESASKKKKKTTKKSTSPREPWALRHSPWQKGARGSLRAREARARLGGLHHLDRAEAARHRGSETGPRGQIQTPSAASVPSSPWGRRVPQGSGAGIGACALAEHGQDASPGVNFSDVHGPSAAPSHELRTAGGHGTRSRRVAPPEKGTRLAGTASEGPYRKTTLAWIQLARP